MLAELNLTELAGIKIGIDTPGEFRYRLLCPFALQMDLEARMKLKPGFGQCHDSH